MNRIEAWVIVKYHTWKYYIMNPSMYWKRLKLNKGLRKVLDLYIGLTKKGK